MKKDFNWDKDNNIDFGKIEGKLGFLINSELKEFYNSNLFKDKIFRLDKKYLTTSINHGNWFEESGNIGITIIGNENLNKFVDIIIDNFDQDAIYGDEKDEVRYILGYITDDRGEIGLYFNNETGMVDWCDYEWGADTWKENPRGVISNTLREFLEILE